MTRAQLLDALWVLLAQGVGVLRNRQGETTRYRVDAILAEDPALTDSDACWFRPYVIATQEYALGTDPR